MGLFVENSLVVFVFFIGMLLFLFNFVGSVDVVVLGLRIFFLIFELGSFFFWFLMLVIGFFLFLFGLGKDLLDFVVIDLSVMNVNIGISIIFFMKKVMKKKDK